MKYYQTKNMENLIVLNETDTCYIKPRLPYFPNGRHFDFQSCPEFYDNSTKKLILHCCLKIIFNVLDNSSYRKTQEWLTYNSSSLLLLPSIFFNLLSLMVLSRFSKLNASDTTINFYMQCLCLFDILTSLSKFIHEFVVVRNSIRTKPFAFNTAFCIFTYFTESAFSIISIYILILMSFDKLICVAFPLNAGVLLRPKRAKFLCAFIILFATVFSSYHITNQRVYVVGPKPLNASKFDDSIYNSSEVKNEAADLKRVIYDCVDQKQNFATQMKLVEIIIRIFVPITLLCLCNISIFIVLTRARQNTRTIISTARESSRIRSSKISKSSSKNPKNEYTLSQMSTSLNTMLANQDAINNLDEGAKCCGLIIKKKEKYYAESSIHNAKADQSSHYISVMLFAVSFGFVFFNLPFAIKTIYERNFQEKRKTLDFLYSNNNDFSTVFTKTDIINAVRYDFFVYLTHFLLDINNIVNFFLYFLSGSKFRSRLYALICRNRKPKWINQHSIDYTNNIQRLLDNRKRETLTSSLQTSKL